MPVSSPRAAASASFLVRFTTLKFSLLLTTGFLACFLLTHLVTEGSDAWDKYRYAKTLRTADSAGNQLVDATFYMLREQPLINGVYRLADATPASVLRNRDEYQRIADAGLAGALSDIATIEFPNKDNLVGALQRAQQAADPARAKARAMAAVPKGQRDQAALTAYNAAIAALIKATQDLWIATTYIEIQSDPTLTRFSGIKSISLKQREIAGLERGILSNALITGTPVTAANKMTIERGRAQIQLGAQVIAELAVLENENSPVRIAMAEARRNYDLTFKPAVDRLIGIGDSQSSYPLSYIEWVTQTNPNIDSFLGILKAAAGAGEQHARELEGDALRQLTIKILGVMLAIAAASMCFFVVIRRVTDPLARLRTTVHHLASGRLDVPVADTHRRDEIGEVARAVDFFKSNLIDSKNFATVRDSEQAAKENRATVLEALAKAFEEKVAGVAESFEASSTELEATSLAVGQRRTDQPAIVQCRGDGAANLEQCATGRRRRQRTGALGARDRRACRPCIAHHP